MGRKIQSQWTFEEPEIRFTDSTRLPEYRAAWDAGYRYLRVDGDTVLLTKKSHRGTTYCPTMESFGQFLNTHMADWIGREYRKE